ncbi:MAG: ElyC/SanA/YdcF family protein [Patescibacteria group bacterium]
MKRFLKIASIVCGVIAVVIVVVVLDVQLKYADRISVHPTGSATTTAIVLGAGVTGNGKPSDALRDRLDMAISLYDQHQVGTLFLTGDDGKYHEDEIDVMKPYVLAHGVATSSIIVDPTGYRTYESCKHAAADGINNAIIVTQRFHLGRALYLCNSLHVNSIGADADLEPYRSIVYFWTRDLLASVEAWSNINLLAPQPPVK